MADLLDLGNMSRGASPSKDGKPPYRCVHLFDDIDT